MSATNQELANLKSQFVISSFRSSHGGRRHKPFAFTEQGVAMLSSVLRSPAAIAVNIEIMRAFVRLRRAALVSEQVVGLIAELAKRVDDHDAAIKDIIETIRTLIDAPKPSQRAIGFVPID
jgi:DNA-binding PadR family transcriptional regulator